MRFAYPPWSAFGPVAPPPAHRRLPGGGFVSRQSSRPRPVVAPSRGVSGLFGKTTRAGRLRNPRPSSFTSPPGPSGPMSSSSPKSSSHSPRAPVSTSAASAPELVRLADIPLSAELTHRHAMDLQLAARTRGQRLRRTRRPRERSRPGAGSARHFDGLIGLGARGL